MSDLHLLPYVRRGLVRQVGAADPGSGGLAAATIELSLAVAGGVADIDAHLLAPHHVVQLAAGEITRRYPTPGSSDVETNYFPLVEFAAPDLPWRYTPAAPGTDGRIRPWLALVVVEVGEGVTFRSTGPAAGELVVEPEAIAQLPTHEELWGWAHVQSTRPAAETARAVTETPDALLARIVCPRRLEPGRTYRAALVNAFAAGPDERAEPAWTASPTNATTLVVYDSWTFSTADEAGDFESLCELLEPATDAGRIGIRRIDVTGCGLSVEWPKTPVHIELVGALADPAVITEAPLAGNEPFAAAAVPVLTDVLGRAQDSAARDPRYDPLEDDPVVGLPFYGSWPSAATEVPASGWARALNVRSDRRIAAGIGAGLVRRNQEALMAAAWEQLGAVREAADELNRGRLSAEVGRAWQARLARVDPGDRIGLASAVLSFVRVAGQPARRALKASRAPTAVADRVWLRRVPRARGASAATVFVRATDPSAPAGDARAFEFGKVAMPDGAHGTDVALLDADVVASRLFDRAALAHIERTRLAQRFGGAQLAAYVRGRTAPAVRRRRAAVAAPGAALAGPSALDVARAIAALDPLRATRASLVSRVRGLSDAIAADELPAGLMLAPEFTDPLFLDLAAVDADMLVPGVDTFPNNRVRLLGVNGGFVGALMVGANHEMARELLWREFPADLAATFFRRFFPYFDPDAADIEPIAGWTPFGSLASNVPASAATTAILIRGDLIRRHPDLNIYIAKTGRDGELDETTVVQPDFEGQLAPDVRVVGFPLAPEVVLGESGGTEYWVVFEERTTAPRFGLDVSRKGELTTWDELAWTDFGGGSHVPATAFPGKGALALGGVVWGRNAAHLAAATHQRPYRRAYPASRLVRR